MAAKILTVGQEIMLGDLIGRAVEYVTSRAKPAKGASVKARGAAAQASGYQGAAQASGFRGAAQALGPHSTALASGEGGKASGKDGCALFLVYRCPSTGAILHAWAGIVGQNGLKPEVFYTLNPNGQPEELA